MRTAQKNCAKPPPANVTNKSFADDTKRVTSENIMKKFLLSPYLIYPLIISGMIAEFKYNLEWAGNLSLFCLWVMVILAFFALLLDGKELFETDESNSVKVGLFFLCLTVQVAVGWIVIAIFSFLAWLFLRIKKTAYKQELTKNAQNNQ